MTIATRTLLILLACLIAPLAMAHDGMKMTMPNGPELGASAAFDSHGQLYVVDAADGHVRLRHSDNGGKTLSAPVIVNAKSEPIYAEGENRPKIAFGPHDELYVSWSQPRAKPWTGFVRFARSLDHGKHFSVPVTVHHDRQEITHRFDAMAVDGHGRIVIAWIDKRDLIAAEASGKPYLGAAVYYSWSNDGGASFVPERKLVDESCECCRIALSLTPQGDVAAFFRSIYGDNIRDHAYAVLRTDGHESKVSRATFSQQSARRYQGGRHIAVTHERHVGNEQGRLQTTRHRSRVIDHVIECHWQGAGLALNHHTQRITDEHRIHPSRVEMCGETRVVASQHGDLRAIDLALAQGRNSDRGALPGILCACIHRLVLEVIEAASEQGNANPVVRQRLCVFAIRSQWLVSS